MIFPRAVTTTSTVPNIDQIAPAQKMAIMIPAIARPIGEGGLSVISKAAGRNASSYSGRLRPVNATARLSDVAIAAEGLLVGAMQAGLQKMEIRVASFAADQFLMRAVLDDAAALERDDPIGVAHGG